MNITKDGYLQALIDEVINNGYAYDLCLECGKTGECKDDPFQSEHSLLNIVDEKIQCQRHKLMNNPLKRPQMLAFVLIVYTGCDCNYDLCASQRSVLICVYGMEYHFYL